MAPAEPSRILEERASGNERLCLALEELRGGFPTAQELAALRESLEWNADSGSYEVESGVRTRLPEPANARSEPPPALAPANDTTAKLAQTCPVLPLRSVESVALQEAEQAKIDERCWRALALVATATAMAASVALLVSSSHDTGHATPATYRVDLPAASDPGAQEPAAVPRPAGAEPPAAATPAADTARPKPPAPKPRVRSPVKPPGPAPEPGRAQPEPEEPRIAALVPDVEQPAESRGAININSIPVSAVLLDGRPLGGTPRIGVAASPGLHRVVFVHPEHGRRYQTVNVDTGRTAVAAVRFR